MNRIGRASAWTAAAAAAPFAGKAFAQPRQPAFQLVDVTARAGLDFRHNSGAYGGKLLPETLGSGCAFLDYDADGNLLSLEVLDASQRVEEPTRVTFSSQG